MVTLVEKRSLVVSHEAHSGQRSLVGYSPRDRSQARLGTQAWPPTVGEGPVEPAFLLYLTGCVISISCYTMEVRGGVVISTESVFPLPLK